LPAILAELDTDLLVRGIAEAACELTAAGFAMYAPFVAEHGSFTIAGPEAEEFSAAPDPTRAPLLAASFRPGEVLRVDDVVKWAPSEAAAVPYGVYRNGAPVRSYLAAPVVARSGDVLGSLFLGHAHPRAFSGKDEQLLAGMAAHLAVALEKADLISERARVANVLQETLLPPLLPAIPGIDCAARYRPTGSGNLVGGDFYDVVTAGKDEWGIVLGDVSGVGPEAAALTGLARYTVRAVAASGGLGPAQILEALNAALVNQRADDRFCTAVYLSLRPGDDGRVRLALASGGHPPPLVLRDDGTVDAVTADGMLLGLFEDAVLTEVEVELAAGDAIVLYTDGVIEARDLTGEQFGQERLEALLATCAGRTAAGIARRLELSVIDHQGGITLDDVAVLVVRADPEPD
jgi:serine phosphatase RsbU (regulator of sigma subunit)